MVVPDNPQTEREAGAPAATDEELIARVSHGDPIAFEMLVNRYQNSALRLAGRFTGRQSEAEDLVQEAFLHVHSHVDRYNPEIAPFKTWFFAILSNLCRNAIKRDKSLSFIEMPMDTPAIDDPARDLAQEEQRAALAAAIAKLTPNQRLAMILRYGRRLQLRRNGGGARRFGQGRRISARAREADAAAGIVIRLSAAFRNSCVSAHIPKNSSSAIFYSVSDALI